MQEFLTQHHRHILVHRTGMRLLLADAQVRQHVENDAGLHFQFSRQLIDTDFAHSSADDPFQAEQSSPPRTPN
jgi:hypothetical protein